MVLCIPNAFNNMYCVGIVRITKIDIKNLKYGKIVDLTLYLRITVGLIPNNCLKPQNSILRILYLNKKKIHNNYLTLGIVTSIRDILFFREIGF